MQDSEKQIYYDIIVRCWKIFATPSAHKEFSDNWWREIVDKFDDVIKVYRNTEYASFTSKIVQDFLNEHERRKTPWKGIIH